MNATLTAVTTPAALERILTTPLKVGTYDSKTVKVAADGYHVAIVSDQMNDAEAYAQLFAASPALLAAAQKLVGIYRDSLADHIGHDLAYAFIAAVAEAKRTSPVTTTAATDDNEDDEDGCSDCDAPLDEAGDGYDGRCPDCADKAEGRANG